MSLISDLKASNAKRWANMKLTRRAAYFGSDKVPGPIPRILAAKNRYDLIQKQTGVHWTFVAATHYRESNLNFNTQLAQGDPLNRPSRNVPRGRGPFENFEQGAYDALVRCDPKAALNPLWKQSEIMPDMLTLLEMYNGLGYARKGIPSPYVWAGTNQYVKGKYVRDGVFDPEHVDTQLGVAGLLYLLKEAQPDVFGKAPTQPTPPVQTPPSEPQKPVQAPPVQQGPIINKDGEDITDMVQDFFHDIWEWLRKH